MRIHGEGPKEVASIRQGARESAGRPKSSVNLTEDELLEEVDVIRALRIVIGQERVKAGHVQ